MNISTINSFSSDATQNFGKLKRVKCRTESIYGRGRCGFYEERIVNELKEIARINNFFRDYDVTAFVAVERGKGATLLMQCKAAAKTFKEKFKNFFSLGEMVLLEKKYNCTDDSSFFLAKEIRDIQDSNKLYDLLNEDK